MMQPKLINYDELQFDELEAAAEAAEKEGKQFKKTYLVFPKAAGADRLRLSDKYLGTLCKGFFRCNSEYLEDLFEETKKENCSFFTYATDAIKSHYYAKSKQFPLEYLSVVVKQSRKPEAATSLLKEVLASKIANLASIPVAYNKMFFYGNQFYLISVDFVPFDYKFATLDECSAKISPTQEVDLKTLYKLFCEGGLTDPESGKKINSSRASAMFEECVPSYLFRKWVLCDSDFRFQNMGLLYNSQKQQYTLAPLFDLEYCVTGHRLCQYRYGDKLLSEIKKDIEFALQVAPNQTKSMINKVYSVYSSGKINTGLIDAPDVVADYEKALLIADYQDCANYFFQACQMAKVKTEDSQNFDC